MLPLTLADGAMVAMTAIILGCGIVVVSIIAGVIKSVFVERAREHTRREIAAYIAEGTMTPADGERILKAAPPSDE